MSVCFALIDFWFFNLIRRKPETVAVIMWPVSDDNYAVLSFGWYTCRLLSRRIIRPWSHVVGLCSPILFAPCFEVSERCSRVERRNRPTTGRIIGEEGSSWDLRMGATNTVLKVGLFSWWTLYFSRPNRFVFSGDSFSRGHDYVSIYMHFL